MTHYVTHHVIVKQRCTKSSGSAIEGMTLMTFTQFYTCPHQMDLADFRRRENFKMSLPLHALLSVPSLFHIAQPTRRLIGFVAE
jgi:hypothetical protein